MLLRGAIPRSGSSRICPTVNPPLFSASSVLSVSGISPGPVNHLLFQAAPDGLPACPPATFYLARATLQGKSPAALTAPRVLHSAYIVNPVSPQKPRPSTGSPSGPAERLPRPARGRSGCCHRSGKVFAIYAALAEVERELFPSAQKQNCPWSEHRVGGRSKAKNDAGKAAVGDVGHGQTRNGRRGLVQRTLKSQVRCSIGTSPPTAALRSWHEQTCSLFSEIHHIDTRPCGPFASPLSHPPIHVTNAFYINMSISGRR